MIKLEKFVFNPFQVNTYVLMGEDGEGYVIDPACYDENEKTILTNYSEKNSLNIKAIINTHCHVDHLLGVEYVREQLNISFYCAEEEQFLIDNSVAQGDFFGLAVEKPSKPDAYISETSKMSINDQEIKIIHVPGHSPGSLCFFLEKEKILLSGDALFSGSIGRTDLPGGNYQLLVNGIKEKLLRLSDEVGVYPGHGPSTTIGNEKLTNLFLQ